MSSVAEKLARKTNRRHPAKQVRLRLVYIDFWSAVKIPSISFIWINGMSCSFLACSLSANNLVACSGRLSVIRALYPPPVSLASPDLSPKRTSCVAAHLLLRSRHVQPLSTH